MKTVYPALVYPEEGIGYGVYLPDFDSHTHGETFYDAIEYARGSIGTWIMFYEDKGEDVPKPNSKPFETKDNEVLTWIDIDSEAYKKSQDLRAVKKNVTLPAWLLEAAKRDGLSLSKVLQEALKEQTGQYHPPGYKTSKQ